MLPCAQMVCHIVRLKTRIYKPDYIYNKTKSVKEKNECKQISSVIPDIIDSKMQTRVTKLSDRYVGFFGKIHPTYSRLERYYVLSYMSSFSPYFNCILQSSWREIQTLRQKISFEASRVVAKQFIVTKWTNSRTTKSNSFMNSHKACKC